MRERGGGLWYPRVESRDEWGSLALEWRKRNKIYEWASPLSKTDLQANLTSNYSYDNIYQLLQVTQGASTTETYSYDLVGNRLSSLGVSPYQYNSSNELTSTPSGSYTYDNNGNRKVDPTGGQYTWDWENRLTQVVLPGTSGTVNFKYDPFGRRIYKSTPNFTGIFVYDGDNLIETLNSSGSVVARYTQTQSIDEPLDEVRSGGTNYYEADGLGSITSLTSSAGAVANTYTYDSFGNATASTGSLGNYFQYTGREFDPETGAYYYRVRYYDQTVGRFASEDPFRFYSDVNFYSYVDNDPTVLIDPYGLYTCVGSAVCNFTPEMGKALDDFEKCLGHNGGFKITCGNDSHGPNDPHSKGLAVDIGHGTNPWLSRDQVVKCFYSAFPSDAWGEQEYNQGNSGEYQYHLQYTPGRNGSTGFGIGIRPHGH
jgi:RHS repeat-associated protein